MSRIRVRSASWVLGAQVFGKIAAFPIGIIVARALGASGKGTLSLLQLVTQLSVVLLGFGMNAALLFLAGRREARGHDAMRLSIGYGVGAVVFLMSMYALVGQDKVGPLLNIDSHLLVCAILVVGPALVLNFMYQVVFGSGSIRAATMVSNASLVLQLVAYVVLFASGMLTLATAVAVWATAVLGEAIAVSALGGRARAHEGVPAGVRPLFQRAYRYGLAMWVASLVGQAALRVDMFLLSAIKGPAEVGVYSVAVTFAELLWLLPSALNAVMVPKVSGEGAQALDVTLRLQRILWPVTIMAGGLVLLGAWAVVPLLYGQEFARAIVPLAFLLPGAVAMAMAVMPSAYLSGSGLPMQWMKASGANLAVNVLANLLLIPVLGAAGASLASAASYSVAAVLIVRSFTRYSSVTLHDALVPRRSDFEAFADGVKLMLSTMPARTWKARE